MPTPTKGPRLGSNPTHQRLMLNTLAAQLLAHHKLTTTLPKAKRLRPVVERLITFGKRGDLASRRRVLRQVPDKSIVHELFTSIAPTMSERPGGYTRITKIGPRKGDNAPMAVIELVMEEYSPRQGTVKEAEAAKTAAVAADNETAVDKADEETAAADTSADAEDVATADSTSADAGEAAEAKNS